MNLMQVKQLALNEEALSFSNLFGDQPKKRAPEDPWSSQKASRESRDAWSEEQNDHVSKMFSINTKK
jgi:hypothetical protein